MNRRSFVNTITLAGLFVSAPKTFAKLNMSLEKKITKPKKLNPGDKVAIVAPATNVADPDDIQRALEVCRYYNFTPILSSLLFQDKGYRTKSAQKRADELNKFFADKDIKAIFCIRGGYGSGEILDLIDYDLIQSNPKVFTGYSDISAIHLAIQKKTNLVTFHSPMLLSAFTDWTARNFEKVIMKNEPIGKIENPNRKNGIREQFPIRTINGGKAKGRLTGGNLSIISSLMGTPYEIDTTDSILFLEDVGEEPYRLDRMLNQLRLAGKFQKVRGIVFGLCSDCVMKSAPPIWDLPIGEVLDKYLSVLPVPSFYGLLIGHTSEQATLPYSLEAQIDADLGIIQIDEPAVV